MTDRGCRCSPRLVWMPCSFLAEVDFRVAATGSMLGSRSLSVCTEAHAVLTCDRMHIIICTCKHTHSHRHARTHPHTHTKRRLCKVTSKDQSKMFDGLKKAPNFVVVEVHKLGRILSEVLYQISKFGSYTLSVQQRRLKGHVH